MDLDMVVIVRAVARPKWRLGAAALEDSLLVCDRCHNIEEIVVALVQALPLRKSWALWVTCQHELPEGYHSI